MISPYDFGTSKEAAEIRTQIEAETARQRSEEAIAAAADEFLRNNAEYESSFFQNDELARALGDRPPTAENLQIAYEERLAREMPQAQLANYIRALERQGGV